MVKISALIFSMNRVNKVIELAKKLEDYVDEIVIIDSSDKEKYNILKNELKFARVYWLPPIGMADLYYAIGINLCKYDWVLQLDDDEEPNNKLLSELKDIISNSPPRVYRILRINDLDKRVFKVVRLYHKKYIVPIGAIHMGLGSKIEYSDLDEKYKIIHHSKETYKQKISTIRRYSIIESYQIGYKITNYLFPRFNISHTSNISKKLNNYFRKLFYLQSRFKKLGWYLIATEFNFGLLLWKLIKNIKNMEKPQIFLSDIIYHILIQINMTKDFSKKVDIWLETLNMNTPINYMGLTEIKNMEKMNKSLNLDSRNGVKNFIKIIEYAHTQFGKTNRTQN